MDPLAELSEPELRRRTSAKWASYDEDVLPLWVAEMDVPLAEPIRMALAEAVAAHDTGYALGPMPLHEAVGTFAAQRWGWQVPGLAQTALVPDVMLGLVEALQLTTRVGDPVLIDDPVYPPFRAFVEHADRQPVTVPLAADGRLDLDALEAAFDAATAGGGRAAYLLCNPHNPSGAVPTLEELTALAELADRTGVRVIADEIHAPIVRSGHDFVAYLSVPGTETAYALLSASKGWSLAGCKAALLFCGSEAASELATLPGIVAHGASHLGVVAHRAAFADGGPWLDAVLRGLDRNVALLEDLLASHLPEVRWRPGAGTYLAWLDVRDTPVGRDPVAAYLAAGVALLDGADFGPSGAGHVRFNLATSPTIIEEAVRRMARAHG